MSGQSSRYHDLDTRFKSLQDGQDLIPQNRQLKEQSPLQFDPYWNFQSVVFQVERTLFSVWKKGFMVKGTPFEATFSLRTAEGSNPDLPIILEGTSAGDFRVFLRVLYPLGVPPVTEYSHWVGVLRLAHQWKFAEIRQKAVDALGPHVSSKPAEEKIRLGTEFHVRAWLKQGLVDLALRKDLEIDKLQQSPFNFDQERIIKFFYIQSKAWQQLEESRQSRSSTFNLNSYINNHIEELFAAELGRIDYIYQPSLDPIA